MHKPGRVPKAQVISSWASSPSVPCISRSSPASPSLAAQCYRILERITRTSRYGVRVLARAVARLGLEQLASSMVMGSVKLTVRCDAAERQRGSVAANIQDPPAGLDDRLAADSSIIVVTTLDSPCTNCTLYYPLYTSASFPRTSYNVARLSLIQQLSVPEQCISLTHGKEIGQYVVGDDAPQPPPMPCRRRQFASKFLSRRARQWRPCASPLGRGQVWLDKKNLNSLRLPLATKKMCAPSTSESYE
ncbi:hypothetical protein V8C42DRAFT_306051 [Trichoderma barbatum]